MSEPILKYEDPIQGALNELVSAMSALNMYPDPLPDELGRPAYVPVLEVEPRYLSACDGWAKHSYEHLHAVFMLLNEAHKEREILKTKLFRMQLAQLDLQKGSHK